MFPSHHPATCINRHIRSNIQQKLSFWKSWTMSNITRAFLLLGLDLWAAFDTIDLSILFKLLQLSYGLHGQALNWVISYLEGRNQYIKSGDSCSDQIPVTDGVTQGSELGPLLFSLYISPVADGIGLFGMSHHQYADDTQRYIAISSSDYRIKMEITESCLHAVQKWFTVNYLALNPDKTKAILLGTRQQTQSSEQQIQHANVAGTEIKLSKNLKTLGVNLDEKFFVCHACSVCFTCLSLSFPRIEANQATVDQWQCRSGHMWYRWFQTGLLQLPTLRNVGRQPVEVTARAEHFGKSRE